MSEQKRFWSKVNQNGPMSKLGTRCWLWTGKLNEKGYARFYPHQHHGVRAHRWIYEQTVGPVPDDLELDHLCGNRHCVNPTHLEAVTHQINVSRGQKGRRLETHCNHGHKWTATNTYYTKKGYRMCRKCHTEWKRTYRLHHPSG